MRCSALIKAKRAGKEPPRVAGAEASNVINLMDALRRSVKGDKGEKSGAARDAGEIVRPADGDRKEKNREAQAPEARELNLWRWKSIARNAHSTSPPSRAAAKASAAAMLS